MPQINTAVAAEYAVASNTFTKAITLTTQPTVLEIGDATQAHFVPQVKLSKWNEVSFSVTLPDPTPLTGKLSTSANKVVWTNNGVTSQFYTKPKYVPPVAVIQTVPSIRYRYEKSGNYNDANIFQDISDVLPASGIRVLAVSVANPTIVFNGLYTPQKFLNMGLVPNTMNFSRKMTKYPAGAIVYDNGNIEFSIIGASQITDATFLQIVIAALTSLGISAYQSTHSPNSNDVLFLDGSGNERKVCGMMRETADVFDFFINVSTDFSQYQFYNAGTSARTSTPGSLNIIAPTITNQQVVTAIMAQFSQVLGLPLVADSYSSQELALISKYTPIYGDQNWIQNATMDSFDLPRCLSAQSADTTEFDITLASAPASNVITLALENSGNNFYYQDVLTPTERDSGAFRPTDIIGSYAIYHATKRDDYSQIGGQNYMAGKVGHIYRPKITDANGVWVWGTLSIVENNLLVTIPQTFLNTAAYPIVVDPTFGYTTAGASVEGAGSAYCFLNTTGFVGTGTSMNWYGNQASGALLTQLAMYTVVGSTGTYFTNSKTVSSTVGIVAGWNTQNYDVDPTFTAINYSLFFIGQISGKTGASIHYDTGSSGVGTTATSSGYVDQTWPSTLTAPTGGTMSFSIYATYSTGGGPTNTDMRLGFGF